MKLCIEVANTSYSLPHASKGLAEVGYAGTGEFFDASFKINEDAIHIKE